MIRAFLAGLIIAALAPSVGIFLVARRYSLLADTLAHVSLVGVALGVLMDFNPLIGSLAISVVAALGMERLQRTKKFFGESILALFLSGSLALALILLSLSNGLNVNIFTYLFGSITTVSPGDLRLIGVLGVIVLTITAIYFKKFFSVSYDEDLARTSGLPVDSLNLLIILVAAIIVSVSMRVVGALLIGALMVIPVLTATQFKKSFKQTLVLALGFSFFSVITGLFTSFYLNLPSGAGIVAAALILFSLSLLKR